VLIIFTDKTAPTEALENRTLWEFLLGSIKIRPYKKYASICVMVTKKYLPNVFPFLNTPSYLNVTNCARQFLSSTDSILCTSRLVTPFLSCLGHSVEQFWCFKLLAEAELAYGQQ